MKSREHKVMNSIIFDHEYDDRCDDYNCNDNDNNDYKNEDIQDWNALWDDVNALSAHR